MNMRLFALLFMIACCASAQMQVTLLGPDGERPLTATLDLGSAPAGSQQNYIFRIRNMGQTEAPVTRISVSGQGFALTSSPPLPLPLLPGSNADFRIRFTPTGGGTYSANLIVNALSSILRATAANEPRVAIEDADGKLVLVSPGETISVGVAERGTTGRRVVYFDNPNGSVVSLRSARIAAGEAFSLSAVPMPLAIQPSERFRAEITFAPGTSGSFFGLLEVNGRTYNLTANGLEPPIPRPTLVVEGVTASAQQPKLFVRFAEPSRTAVTGTLQMEFRPLAGRDDPAVRFMNPGGRQVSVRVNAGDNLAYAGTVGELPFQTGTTAGTIVFTLKLGPHTEVLSVELPRAAIKLDTAGAVRRVNDLDVTLAGFDNTRGANQALFTFFDTAGRPVSPGTIRVDIAREFDQFFSGSVAGGTFLMRASFPVTGAASEVTDVEVELVNPVGGTRTERLKIK